MRLPAGVQRRLPGSTSLRLLLAAAALALAGVGAAYAVLVASTVNAPPVAQLSGRPSLPDTGPGPASSTCATTATSTPRAFDGAEGPWVVAGGGGGGFVGYRAAEILALDWIRSPNDAVGRTTAVEGSLEIEGSRLVEARITADVSQMRSDLEIRDGHLAEFLDLREHPDATFELSEPVELGEVVIDRLVEVVVTGDLTLLETKRSVDVSLQARWNGDSVQVAGALPIQRSDWGMDVPQLLGFRVAEDIIIELELFFVRPSGDRCAPAPTIDPGTSPGPSAPVPATPPPIQVAELEAWPDGAGPIAFVAFTGDPFTGSAPGEIFLLRDGETAPTVLTDTPGGFADDPAWSLDGSRLVYARYPYEQPPTLWLTDAAGAEGSQVTTAQLRRPSWSPDGRFLVAVPADELDTRIVRVNLETGEAATLLDDAGVEDGPRWSPDGKRVVFSLLRAGANDEDLYVMNADGSAVSRLTNDPAYEYSPAWSPSGTRIAFVRGGDLWAMRSDGTAARRLTSGLLVDAPTWSPDGRQIAFVVTSGGVMAPDENRRYLWVIDADGANASRLALDAFLIARPAWRPAEQ